MLKWNVCRRDVHPVHTSAAGIVGPGWEAAAIGAERTEQRMAASFQIVIDCQDPDRMARFWVSALRYQFEPPPEGFASWDEYWRDFGLPEEDLGIGEDRIMDPAGQGPRFWFQAVPEAKTIKNRIHFDVQASGGSGTPIEDRRERVDAEARRLAGLGATIIQVLYQEGLDHYAVAMTDPEGNEFDIK